MKKSKAISLVVLSIAILIIMCCMVLFTSCSKAGTITHNIQKEADEFNVYRKMTFVNLYTNEPLYSAEGYFSVQTTYSNDYQGQQEIALTFLVGYNKYKMDYFSIAENVCYVIEQLENTNTDPYYWIIVWYVPLPNVIGG